MHHVTPNIGSRGRRRRLRFGAVNLAAALALALVLVQAGAPLMLRALVFLPLLGAAYGFFQHRAKT